MQTGYQLRRYHNGEREEEYNAHTAYNEYGNNNDRYNTYYYTDNGCGTYNSDGKDSHANINNYKVGNCGHTDEFDGCCYYTNNGYHCKGDKYGRYYNKYEGYSNKYVGPKTEGYKTNFPLNDEDSGPTSREGGRGYSIKEMCGIADHTKDIAYGRHSLVDF